MARSKRSKRKAVGGNLVLELHQSTLESWCKLQCGDILLMTGTAHKWGAHPDASEDIKFDLTKNDKELICVDLRACSMGKIFQQKLSDTWHCSITPAEQQTSRLAEGSVEVEHKPAVADDAPSCASPTAGNNQSASELMGEHVGIKEEGLDCEQETINAEGEYDHNEGLLDRMNEDVSREAVGEHSDLLNKTDTTQSDDDDCEDQDDDAEADDDFVDDDTDDKEFVTSMDTEDCEDSLLSFSCRFCKKSFHKSNNPKRALTSHETRVCRKNPGSASRLAPVKHTKSEQYPFECALCTCAFKTEPGLLQHSNKMHGKPEGEESVPDLDALGMINCDICDRPCLSERARRLHKTLHHGVQEPRRPVVQSKTTCTFCGEVFNNKITHRQHIRYKCAKNPAAVKCSYCNICLRAFPSDKLEAHKSKKHKEIIRKVCEICGAEFNSRNGLYIHKRRVHNSRPPEWHCEPCNKSFQFKFQLEKHLTKHSEERKIMCSVCGKMFKHRDQEIKHRRRVHEGHYPYHCDLCGHGMSDKGKLDTHKCGRVRRSKASKTTAPVYSSVESDNIQVIPNMVETEILEIDGSTGQHPALLSLTPDMGGTHMMPIPDYTQGVWHVPDISYSNNIYQ